MRLRYIIPVALLLFLLGAYLLTQRTAPERIEYGMTFSVLYAQELGLDWKVLYADMLSDLGVRKLRIPVYWSRVEAERGTYVWDELDHQLRQAGEHDASVILAIGRRVPRWPECHIPDWAQHESWEDQKKDQLAFMQSVVERYRADKSVIMWQVENEPYLPVFAEEACGALDEVFLEAEIALVRSLDTRPILTTDSGNLGTWAGAYRHGDVFGTSIYLYFWNESLGSFRTILPPAYYRAKANIMRFVFGERPVMVSELSLEPWFGAAFETVPLSEQLTRMNIGTFQEIIAYSRDTNIAPQYLWGVEWWYYMKTKSGHPEFWDAGRELFK